MDRNSKIYTDGCVDATFSFFLKEDNLILLICIGGAMVLLQVSMINNFIVFLKTAFMQIFKKFGLQMIEEKHFSVLVKTSIFCLFGPRVYPRGSLVIALVRGPSVGPSVSPSVNISETANCFFSNFLHEVRAP